MAMHVMAVVDNLAADAGLRYLVNVHPCQVMRAFHYYSPDWDDCRDIHDLVASSAIRPADAYACSMEDLNTMHHYCLFYVTSCLSC